MPGHAHAGSLREQNRQAMSPLHRCGLLAAIAVGALSIGTLVYLFDRVPGHALLIPRLDSFAGAPFFGALGAWLPSFVHPFSFALLTAAALPAASAWRYHGCAAWGAVNLAFELGQHPALKGWWLESVAGDALPIVRWFARYFLHGTFDVVDLVVVIAGAAAAAAMLRWVGRHQEHPHER